MEYVAANVEIFSPLILLACIAVAMLYRAFMGRRSGSTSADIELGDADGGGGDGGD